MYTILFTLAFFISLNSGGDILAMHILLGVYFDSLIVAIWGLIRWMNKRKQDDCDEEDTTTYD